MTTPVVVTRATISGDAGNVGGHHGRYQSGITNCRPVPVGYFLAIVLNPLVKLLEDKDPTDTGGYFTRNHYYFTDGAAVWPLRLFTQ